MKIVIDSRMINKSGIGRYLRSLLPELLKNKRNFYTLLGSEIELSKYLGKNVEIITVKSSIYNPIEHWELRKKIPECDIYFSPHFITPFFKVPAAKRITTIHDMFHLSDLADFSLLKKLYLKFLYKNAIAKSDEIITVSSSSSDEILRFSGMQNNTVHVIYNSIDSELFKKSRSRPGVQGKYLLFVGNIKPHKNLIRLVNAFDQIDSEDLKLVIVGDRDGFINGIPGFDCIIESNENILFTGKISDEQLIDYYSNAEVFVFPSLYEGFGYPPLEAMSCGTAVAASDIPVIREICNDSVLYFNPLEPNDIKDKIMELVGSKIKREEFVVKGRDRSSYFSKEQFIEKHLVLFQETK